MPRNAAGRASAATRPSPKPRSPAREESGAKIRPSANSSSAILPPIRTGTSWRRAAGVAALARRDSSTAAARATAARDGGLRLLEPGRERRGRVHQRQIRRMVAVVAGERVEQDGDRLEHEHVGVRDRDEHAAGGRLEAAARECEQRVHEQREDEIRAEHTRRVGGGAVGLVQDAEERRETDGGEEQAEAGVGPEPERDHPRADEHEADDRRQRRLDDRIRRDPAHGDHVDGGAGRGQGGHDQGDRERDGETARGVVPPPPRSRGGVVDRRARLDRLLVHPSRLASAAPERSSFETNPRAPLPSISGP